MTNTLYTTKTPTNQALTVQPWGNRIALPILLPVLLIGLFILSACGGGSKAASPTVQTPPPPAASCATNPFSDSCNLLEHETARDIIIKECIAGSDPASRPSCANAIGKNPCIRNPYATNCAVDFVNYVNAAQMQRQTFCRMDDNARDAFCRPAVTSICDGNIFDGICNSNAATQESFCRMGTNADDNRNCDSIVKDICDKNPLFDGLCTPDITAQREHCRMNTNAADDPTNCGPVVVGICADDPFDGLCAVDNNAREDFCRKGDNLTTRAGDCAPVAIRVCADRVFDGLCRDHADQRSNLCVGNLAGITAAGGMPADCATYSATICGRNGAAGTNPFAPICTRIDVNSEFATNSRSRNAFCQENLFNPLCDDGYINAQVRACHLNGIPTEVSPRCPMIIANNCPFITTGARNPACHTLVTPLTSAGSTDPEVNYVAGMPTELNLIFDQTTRPDNISGFESGILFLSNLATVNSPDGDTDGVAWATFTNSASESVTGTQSKQRFYAGLLSTTNLSTPKISRNVKRAEWTGQLALYARGTNRTTPFNFTLLVDFDGNEGTLRADIDIPIPSPNPTNINDLFIIDGAFTSDGVVYGNTSLHGVGANQNSLSSIGSLIGQIGENGVVAAFISDGADKGLGNYVGGFVASNPYKDDATTMVECGSASTDTPFHPLCADNDNVRTMLCSTRNTLAGTGDTFTINCIEDRDVIAAICADSGQYANPFDSVICTDEQLEVQTAFVDNCTDSDTSLRAGADCAGVTACVADAFATTCDAVIYANSRTMLLDICNTAALGGNHDWPGCENARVNCATANPHANCGELTTTYCTGAAGRTIAGDTSTCPVRVTAYCVNYPLNPLCEDITANTAFVAAALKLSREDFCRTSIKANDPNCIPTIATYCDAATGDEIYDDLCDIGLFTQSFIGETCDSETRDSSLDTLCDSTSTYSVARLKRCNATNFDDDKCRAGYDPQYVTTGTNWCGSDIHNTVSNDPICKIDPQILQTVGVLCGTDDSIAIDPFDAICNNDNLYRPDAESSARTTARKLGQESFCREGFRAITRAAIAADTTPVYTPTTDCTMTIATYCNAQSGADLFDDLCDGDTYLADRATHCATAFTHAKCADDEMNIAEAEAICGTEDAPGTNPFNEVCSSSTLSPDITAMSLLATQRAFCRGDLMNSDCENTIKGFCDGNTDVTILDDLCDGADYTDARLGYCIHPNADHMECGTVANNKMKITTLCGDAQTTGTNPFSIACTTAFLLRIEIDALCGGGRNSQVPLCMEENAIPAIDRASVTASQENFCRGDITMPACENTIADFCDLAFDTDILDPLCGGAGYQDMRLMTCLNLGIDHPSCNGTAGIVATLCPTDGGARNELCPAIVDHASYLTSVDDLDVNDDSMSGFINSQAAAGVINKNTVHVPDNLRDDDYDVDDDVERAIGFATDAPATLITGKSDSTGLDFGTLPPARTTIRNGGDPVQITVGLLSNAATITSTITRMVGNGMVTTNYGYALASALITTEDGGVSSSETKLYAGLLPISGFDTPSLTNQGLTTKLGVAEPTLDITPTGIWSADMNLMMFGSLTAHTFDLSVDFKAQTIKTLASRTAQFTLTGADFAEPRFTASDSPVVRLYDPEVFEDGDHAAYYRRDSRDEEIIVGRGDTYTDCDGNRLNPGSRVPLCRGGGSPDYDTRKHSYTTRTVFAANTFGNPRILTQTKQTTGRLTIDASFTPTGLVYGDITIQTGFLNDDGDFIGKRGGDLLSSAGRIVGQINDAELIGAFASNAGSAEAYVGGFTATPTATVTHFAKGGANGLDVTNPISNSNIAYKIAGTENGFAIADTAPNSIRNLHAGLLTGTNLGNPLLDNSMSGIWNANLNARFISARSGTLIRYDVTSEFELNVDFDAKTIKTLENSGASFTLSGSGFTVSVTHPGDVTTQEPSVGVITIDGRFSHAGRVTGTTHFQISNPNEPAFGSGTGILTGLIGENGLVAAFVSDAGSANAYAGGFTATRAETDGAFTAGGTDGLTLTGTAVTPTTATPRPIGVTINTAYKIAGTNNGFALASENIDNSGTTETKLYAGLLSGIDLGKPLFDNRATGVWTANLNAIILRNARDSQTTALTTVTTAVSSTFDLRVDFDTRTLKTVQDSATPFTFATGLDTVQRTADKSPLVALTYLDDQQMQQPLYHTYDVHRTGTPVLAGEMIAGCDGELLDVGYIIPKCSARLVQSHERGITDCSGTPLAVGAPIPLCEGDNSPVYKRDTTNPSETNNVMLDSDGLPLVEVMPAFTSGRIIVDGRFTSSGVISGKTSLDYAGISESGTLTGVIGTKGAVAAFVGDAESGNTYVGGFTATAGVCTIGGTLFDKTACPDTNIAAKNLRLQLCLNRDPAAEPFATNCGSADEIAFIAGCLENPTHDLGCNTGAVAECLNDPYSFNCRSASYTPARTAHLDICAITTAPANPRCVNLRRQLDNCAVAQPDPSCGTLVNDFCLGGAGRVIAGKTTCVENIRVACVANALHPRCRDVGIFTTKETHEAHIDKQHDFCEGAIASLPTGATVSDCRTLGLSFDICGTPTAFGSNPFAPICSDEMGNPYFEQVEQAQALFCRQSPMIANEETVRDPRCTQLGTTANWRDDATRGVAVPVLDDNGDTQIDPNTGLTVTRIEQRSVPIKNADTLTPKDADVNYIVGGTDKLDLDGLTERDEDGNLIDNDPTSINSAKTLTLSTFDGNEDTASGFALARAIYSDVKRNRATGIVGGPGSKLYVGLLEDTDVGAPLTDIQTNAEWTGKMNVLISSASRSPSRGNTSIANYDNQPVNLLVSFYGSFGLIKTKTNVRLDNEAFVNIDGRFTDRGVISGKVSFLELDTGARRQSGSLTGLIGAEGAVATFISDDRNADNIYSTYVGGFVALPPATPSTAPRADFAAWLDSFDAPNIPLTRAIRTQDFTSANDKQYFLQGTVSGLNRANDNYANENGGNNPTVLTLGESFDGDVYDGVAYLVGTGRRAYAGVLLGTDLGAPVTGTTGTTAQWAGRFHDSRYVTTETSFTLTVGFTAEGGTLDALVERSFGGNERTGINGAFDANGIITGEVINGTPNASGCLTNGRLTVTESCFTGSNTATLTGLIGEQGVVGAFTGQWGSFPNQLGWIGGFVALSCADNPSAGYCVVNAKDWVDSFDESGGIPIDNVIASETGIETITGTDTERNDRNIFGGFVNLVGDATSITPQGLRTTINGFSYVTHSISFPPTTRLYRAGSNEKDGVAYISGFNRAKNQAFVGILPTTDLGLPLAEQPAMAEWSGTYYDSIAAPSTPPAITFVIDFDESDISVKAGSAAGTPPTFDLGFDRLGVIRGTVTKNSIQATARGLIGTEGLVGGFVDTSPTSGNVFHGGFVATNPSP